MAEEEITAFMGRMIERGEMAEKDARKLMREVLERREKILRERREAAERKEKAQAASPADLADLQANMKSPAQYKTDKLAEECKVITAKFIATSFEDYKTPASPYAGDPVKAAQAVLDALAK